MGTQKNVNGLSLKSLLLLGVGALLTTAAYLALDRGASAQTTRTVTWEVSAIMKNPLNGQNNYRFEDPEYKIVCYSREKDFSGGSMSCVKK